MSKNENVYLRCDDNAEMATFTKRQWGDNTISYELNIEDSYCGGDYRGLRGRFKRAWHAFFGKPVYYTGVFCEDPLRIKAFLQESLDIINRDEAPPKE